MWKPGAQRELGIVNGKRMRLPPSCADSAAQQDAETQPAEQPGPRAGGPQLKKQQKLSVETARKPTCPRPGLETNCVEPSGKGHEPDDEYQHRDSVKNLDFLRMPDAT